MTPRDGSESSVAGERYLANWRDEIDSAALYGALADLRVRSAAGRCLPPSCGGRRAPCGLLGGEAAGPGARVPERRPGWRTRVLIAVARRLGTQVVLPTLNDLERADSSGYYQQPESRGTAMPAEERSHARVLRSLSGSAGVEGAALGRFEGRHRAASGNALRSRCSPGAAHSSPMDARS